MRRGVQMRVTGRALLGSVAILLAGCGSSSPTTPQVPAPTGLNYSLNPASYPKGVAIAPNTPSSGGGAVSSYAVNPALPAGLTLNTTTGVITGTPGTAAPATNYTVTATNAGGSASVGLSITVTQTAATATQLAITTQPATTSEGVALPASVRVEIRDADGALVTSATNTVTLAIGNNAGNGTLGGTQTAAAVAGVATFPGLSINQAGTAYTLTAAANGLTGTTSTPFNVLINFISVGVGSFTTCGVSVSGAAYCWGRNDLGQLGDGTIVNRSLPTRVVAPGGVQFLAVAQNGRDASAGVANCGRTTTGAAYCWGSGSAGNIGDGALLDRLTATLVAAPGGVAFNSITAGGVHSCGTTAGGAGYCWGIGVRGALGDGTGLNRPLPTQVPAPGGGLFATIGAGSGTTCGTTQAGAAYCWGAGTSSQIGDGAAVDRLSPTLVAAPGGVTFAAAQAGGSVSCGLAFGGVVYCWGSGANGQIGDGANATRATPVPVTAPGGVTFSRLATSVIHSCALSTTGAAYCWGANTVGQLGDGTLTDRNVPTAVSMPVGVTFTAISAGQDHSCGLTAQGAIYCWGWNTNGQLGDGTTVSPRLTPVRVAR